MREYRRVPALESGSKLSNPDLQDIGEKNYTDIILRYGNLTTKFPQLDTNAKTIVAAINELYAHPGGSIVIPNPPIGSDSLETESGDTIETESGEPIEPEQGGSGGHVVGPLYSIGIDGDIYTIEGGSGETYTAGKLINISSENVIGVNMTESTPANIEQASRNNPNTLFFTEGLAGIMVVAVSLTANGWNSSTKQQTVSVSGVTGNNNVLVSPVSDTTSNYDNYTSAGIRAISQTTGSITFQCTTIPTSTVSVCIGYWG